MAVRKKTRNKKREYGDLIKQYLEEKDFETKTRRKTKSLVRKKEKLLVKKKELESNISECIQPLDKYKKRLRKINDELNGLV